MGDAGNGVGAQFRRAVAQGDYRGARLLALEMPRVSLETALALTLLAAETGDAPYPPMARRWLAKLITARAPDLSAVALVAQLLADVDEGRLDASKIEEPLTRAARGLRIG